ncbi:carboxyltransferase domain-containing protein [Sorangium sp. So ce1036]|uniref:5-oxoprolinase subunit B/C family protein n=1 Tax=Sorangium sp. So ce1036 TaxID=3133328 RepID=UPI003F0E86FB
MRPRAVLPYGEAAIYLDLGLERARDRAARTHAAAALVRAALPPGALSEVVLGAGTLILAGIAEGARPAVDALLSRLSADLDPGSGEASSPAALRGREHAIHVVYDGPDLAETAAALGATPREVVALHTGREVVVELLGFLPGFAYMGDVAERLVRPRRATPRPSVPAGSVAIAGTFTGIYPMSSPGGWTLLGRAVSAPPLFDADRDPPALFAPGDRVRFIAVAPEDAGPPPPAARPAPREDRAPRALGIVAAPPGATVQDAGRRGMLSKGLPPSGPLDAVTHAAANLAVGNPSGAAAIEIPLGDLTICAEGRLLVSIDGERPRTLHDGEALRIDATSRAVRYLAVRGGIGVPVRSGARATLLAARLGGLDGRPLRRGDRLPVGDEAEPAGPPADVGPAGAPAEGPTPLLEVDPGPHAARFPAAALDALLETAWRISRWGDRVGVRLEGGRIPREGPDLALPAPMLRGAVQIATDGTPIVLGPDHPVTGGYPVLAVVRQADQPRLARLRPGDTLRFRLGH